MVTSADASALAGTAFGAGKFDPTYGQCDYSSPTLRFVAVQAVRAQSAAQAQAAWSEEAARVPALLQRAANAPNLVAHVTPVSGYGDRAAVISGSATLGGVTLSVNGMYLLKGATFTGFEVMELNHPAPSTAAVEAEARTVLGRM